MAELSVRDPSPTARPRLKSAPLKKHLAAEVVSGRLKPGSQLPTERQLAGKFEVSVPTVRRALAELEGEGLIRREQGRGTFVKEESQPQGEVANETFAMMFLDTNDLCGPAMIRGFEQECRATHRNMLLFDSENDIDRQCGMLYRLSRLNIAGVAIQPVVTRPTPDYHIGLLHDRNIPVVLCHRGVAGVDAPVLSVSHEEEGRLAGQSFAEQGHRRVAFVMAIEADRLQDKWVRGLREGLQSAGGELPDEFVFTCPASLLDYDKQEESLLKTLEEMLGSKNPPTGIFVQPDDFAYVVERTLQRMGLRVPEDISLVGLGGANRDSAFTRRLTSVVVDEVDMSRRAVRVLDEIASGKRNLHDAEDLAMPISLSGGQTLGPVSKSVGIPANKPS